MSNHFRIEGLAAKPFKALMSMCDEALKQHGAYWLVADVCPGFPCRVSLQDAAVGEQVLVCHYQHHDVSTPYQSSGPIFVRAHAVTTAWGVDQIPPVLPHRQLSLRGYGQNHLMLAATVVAGHQVAGAIKSMLSDPAVNYVHIHNAAPGCFSCVARRVEAL